MNYLLLIYLLSIDERRVHPEVPREAGGKDEVQTGRPLNDLFKIYFHRGKHLEQ